jgi:hypothetical protein
MQTVNRVRFRTVLLTASFVAAVSAQPPSAHVIGKIVDENNKPLPNARVHYQRMPRVVKDNRGHLHELPGEAHVNAQTSTDITGSYSASQLPDGLYILCAGAPGYLSSCDWNGWHRLSLNNGQVLDFGRITLAKAATVSIRVEDPLRLLPPGVQELPSLALGVLDQNDNFHPAQPVALDTTGRTFQVSVPFAKPMRFWAQSPKYTFTDAAGTPLNSAGLRIPFQVDLNGKPPSFILRIAGAKN